MVITGVERGGPDKHSSGKNESECDGGGGVSDAKRALYSPESTSENDSLNYNRDEFDENNSVRQENMYEPLSSDGDQSDNEETEISISRRQIDDNNENAIDVKTTVNEQSDDNLVRGDTSESNVQDGCERKSCNIAKQADVENPASRTLFTIDSIIGRRMPSHLNSVSTLESPTTHISGDITSKSDKTSDLKSDEESDNCEEENHNKLNIFDTIPNPPPKIVDLEQLKQRELLYSQLPYKHYAYLQALSQMQPHFAATLLPQRPTGLEASSLSLNGTGLLGKSCKPVFTKSIHGRNVSPSAFCLHHVPRRYLQCWEIDS